MDKKYALSILGAALIGFVGVLLLMPPTIDDGVVRLPWRAEVTAEGHTRVFGFTLGETTPAQVREVFGEDGKINLFQNPDAAEPYEVELYFEQIYLQSLRADFVMTLKVEQERLGEMFERGLRISQLGSGAKKIKLDPSDVERLLGVPIRSITYLPKAKLDKPLLAKLFGEPVERLTEQESDIVHWLYPERGIDLARDPAGKVVIQFVNPGDFPRLQEPLRAATAAAESAAAQ